jgi:phytoene dehydrogenase-like protein
VSFDAVVAGAGTNGIVCAAYLARAGMRVVVLERRERPGGIADTDEIAPGLRAPGPVPTVGRLRRSVITDLDLARHGLELIEPDVRRLLPRADGAPLVFHADADRTAAGLGDPDYARFDAHVRALAGFLAELNRSTPPRLDGVRAGDLATGLRLGRALRGLGAERTRELTRALPMPAADVLREWLSDDAACGALAARGSLYTALAPWSAGSGLVLLNDSAEGDGGAAGEATFARGGPGALGDALARAARAAGAQVRLGATVERVLTDGDRVRGVALAGGEEVEAPVVASAVDPKTVLTRWLDPVVAGPTLVWRAGNIRTPGATATVDLALSAVPAFRGVDDEALLSGRIVVAEGIDGIERAFDAWKYGEVAERPLIEATIPTIADRSLAPGGGHVLAAVVQWVPYRLRAGAWGDRRRAALADRVVAALERVAPGIGALVTARRVRVPPDLEREYGLSGGHVMHGELALDQFFAWRPVLGLARYRLAVRGLYLCGSGAHPGGGITGGPGQNAAAAIVRDVG